MALHISFEGKRVLVTGGGRGIGKEIVKKLSNDGANVVTIEREQSLLDSLKLEIPGVDGICLDLSDWKRTEEIIEKNGPFDYLVNNAGILCVENFLDIQEETLDKIFGINMKAVINVSKCVAKGMIQHEIKGGIVNFASILAKYSMPGLLSYSCSKAGIVSITKSMALELAKHDIRVNAVGPGGVKTQMLQQLVDIPAALKDRIITNKKIIETEEIADLVLFLLSSKAISITGQTIYIDQGISTN